MLCVLLYSGALGVLIGYIITARMVINASWHWAFNIQVFATIALFLVVMFIPVKNLDLRIVIDTETTAEHGTEISENHVSVNNIAFICQFVPIVILTLIIMFRFLGNSAIH